MNKFALTSQISTYLQILHKAAFTPTRSEEKRSEAKFSCCKIQICGKIWQIYASLRFRAREHFKHVCYFRFQSLRFAFGVHIHGYTPYPLHRFEMFALHRFASMDITKPHSLCCQCKNYTKLPRVLTTTGCLGNLGNN